MKNDTITIPIYILFVLVFSCVIVTISVGALLIKIYGYVRKTDERKKFDDIDDYYFSNYEKHITIYKNGNGIIIHKFTVIINNIEKFKRIRRRLNIEDGRKDVNFPPLVTMMNTKKSERFDKFGFWYYDKDNIISEVKEFYWQKNSSEENRKSKNNPKELRWIFRINSQHIRPKVPYDIIYAISVPGIAPLVDGKLDPSLLAEDFNDTSVSSMNIDHKIRDFKYVISFEQEVELDNTPKCRYIEAKQDESKEVEIFGEKEDNILYNKYIFRINSPKFNSDIKITWKYNKTNTI